MSELGWRRWPFLGRLSRGWREALTRLGKVPPSLVFSAGDPERGGGTGAPTACPCLSVIPSSHGPFSKEEAESRDGKCFAQDPWLSESGRRLRPRGPPVHGTEMAAASPMTSPPHTHTLFPPRTLTSASKIILPSSAGSSRRLGSQPEAKEGRGISGSAALGSRPPHSPFRSSHEVWRGLHRAPRGAPEAISAPPPGPLFSHHHPPQCGKRKEAWALVSTCHRLDWKGHPLGRLAPAC